ncbi:MAG: EAL domain-containing protein, partial [Spirochaetia bacterium]|nr:EAL domain-containing protein [Spirochaetia bacterium]
QNSIENIISKSKTEDCVFYVLFLDLDRFKSVNDTHGHSIGDQLLISLSLKMKEITHQLQAMIGRFGGDEFIIILPSCSTKDEAETAAKQIHLVTSEPFEQNGLRFILGSSIGISKFPEDGEDSETLIKHADTAMYQAKKKGHDINFYSEDIGLTTTASFQLESLLKQAIMDHKIEVHYQPIMDLHTGKVLSVESLARWNLNDQQEILPSIFIKIAEDIGKIDELDKFIASESIKQLSEWKKQGFLINISLNVSAKRFQQSSFFSETMEMLTQHQLKPENLQFEITESALLEDLSQSIEKINLMKQYNFNFAIDDFGTGFSSLNYLISLPVNHIKLDRSFITPLTKGSKLMALVDGIITIATNLDMNIIPEGIETEEQYQLLKQMGLTKGQGYYFSKPLNSQKMTAFLKNNL